jgi:hypothetical protein
MPVFIPQEFAMLIGLNQCRLEHGIKDRITEAEEISTGVPSTEPLVVKRRQKMRQAELLKQPASIFTYPA